MGFHPHWSCFTVRSVTKENLWNGFPSSLELFYPSFCDQREPLKWVSILTGVVLLFCDQKSGFPSSLELFYPSFCEPLKWVSILTGVVLPFVLWPKTGTFEMGFHLTGVVLPFVLWPKRTFEMGFHPHWSCFTLRSVTKENLWNGFPSSLELFYPSFCDQREPFKWVSILTGVVLLFELWPKWTFEMGFHSDWSCFTLRSVTKENLLNGFPFSLELSSNYDQSEPLKWVSILTGVVLPFVLWPKWTFEMGFHSHWSCFTLRSVTTFEIGFHPHWSCFTVRSVTKEKWVSILTGVVLVLWTFEMGFHSHWSCFTLRSVTKVNLWNGFPFTHWSCFTSSFCDQSEPLKWVSILTGVVLPFVLWPKWTF